MTAPLAVSVSVNEEAIVPLILCPILRDTILYESAVEMPVPAESGCTVTRIDSAP